MRIKNSFWNFLGPEPVETEEQTLERIRTAMLHVLRGYCPNADFHLEFRITYAKDITELWYLRSELMQALCAHQAETQAHALMVGVTTLFVGHHPAASGSKLHKPGR
ncbi:hypothetical protein [uncultured Rhodoferax sp.]|uniref:hypothetical protein n=1 Tax=uncultured Rhodoferax sp. TaxID=223188 RepID=UPI0025F18EF9|nr:hypothetical protein [uncultured Rhodoferax sp.]